MIAGRIYLDYNATTPLLESVRDAMQAALGQLYGNPSSVHNEGQRARAAVERARRDVAKLVGVSSRHIVFTSGASEANNWAIRRFAGGGHIVTTPIEHPSVLDACEEAVARGGAQGVTRLPVDGMGRLNLDDLAVRLQHTPSVSLVSVMAANNETGNRYDVARVADMCRAHTVTSHTDATQLVGRLPVSFANWEIDLVSFSAHKLYGPKGVGALYIRHVEGAIPPLLMGGHQERGRRAGTENTLGIVGFGAAAQAANDLVTEAARQQRLRDLLQDELIGRLGAVVNGSPDMPNTLNASFLGCEAEGLLMALDLEGVSVSAGSACSAGSLDPSPVICAITNDESRRRSAVRFSIGRFVEEPDIRVAIVCIERCVRRLRLEE